MSWDELHTWLRVGWVSVAALVVVVLVAWELSLTIRRWRR